MEKMFLSFGNCTFRIFVEMKKKSKEEAGSSEQCGSSEIIVST